MHDRLAGDHHRPFRLLTIVDIFTRECLALEVATGFRARNVVHVLSRLVARRGAPIAIRCDQGTEFTAEALDQWAYNNRIELDFSRPGKPTDNAFIEAFNASVRKELLNTSWKVFGERRVRGVESTTRFARIDRWPTKRRKPLRRRQLRRLDNRRSQYPLVQRWGTRSA